MVTWENFKKKMFKKNKIFERDFKEIERRIMKTEVLFYLLFSIVATIYVFYKSIRLRDFDGLTITVLSLGILNSFLCVYILVAYS